MVPIETDTLPQLIEHCKVNCTWDYNSNNPDFDELEQRNRHAKVDAFRCHLRGKQMRAVLVMATMKPVKHLNVASFMLLNKDKRSPKILASTPEVSKLLEKRVPVCSSSSSEAEEEEASLSLGKCIEEVEMVGRAVDQQL